MDKRSAKFARWPEMLIILQSVVYGFGDPISKIAFEVTPVYSMMTVRYSIAFLVCFILFHKRIIRTVKTVPVKAWLIPGLCIGLTYLLNNVALSLTDATSVAFLRSLSVVITPVFAYLLYRTHYSRLHIILAAFAAGALVFTKGYIEMVDPVSLTALQAGCSAAIALGGSLIFEGGIHMERTTPIAWLIILYLAIACTFLGYLMQNLALTKISERSVALLQTLCPVMTACFAFFLLGERLSPAGIAGAVIIIVCVAASTAAGGKD